MKLREITIKNFRCLVDVRIPIADTQVLIGENNSGKTAFLEALRITLPRSVAGRQDPFDEYDYHMCNSGDSPENCEGIVIELWFREDTPNEWPDSLMQALTEVIQTDPIRDLNSLGLRLSSRYDDTIKDFVTKWEFLEINGEPLRGRGASPTNLGKFLNYLRLFYLSALRNSDTEFSPRSQFWGRLLRDLKISEEQRKQLEEDLAKLNGELLKADPKLEQIIASLDKVHNVMSLGAGIKTSIQALPLKPWDLMSRSQVVMRTRGNEIDFPISRHGQGMQSLAILFLFQAYIDIALKPQFHPETEAILALEEPEAHLHPQAIRSLATNLCEVTSQKIISCHSPYFIQETPFSQIIMFRKEGPSVNVYYIKRSYTVEVPASTELLEFCKNNEQKFDYHTGTSVLSVKGRMEEEEYRKLLTIYAGRRDLHKKLKNFKNESQSYLTESELTDLDTYAKRIRGDILFARAWLLCEGQSEYLILRYFAELLGMPLDNAGVAVIDFQNNGSPGAFVGLAQAYRTPWVMVCDNDDAGKGFIDQANNHGPTEAELSKVVKLLPEEGDNLELFLARNGFMEDYITILDETAKLSQPYSTEWIMAKQSINKGQEIRQVVLQMDGSHELRILRDGHLDKTILQSDSGFQALLLEIITTELQEDKVRNANALINRLRMKKIDKDRVPLFLSEIIKDIVTRAI